MPIRISADRHGRAGVTSVCHFGSKRAEAARGAISPMAFEALKRLGSLSKMRTSLQSSVAALPVGGVSPIGIDFGAGGLKILQVNCGDPPSLVAAAYLETPENLLEDDMKRLDFQAQALPRLIRDGGFKGKRAVCAIPAFQTFCKNLQFPKTDGITTQAMVDAAIPAQFNRDPSQMVYRTIDVSTPGTGKCEVIVVAAMRELVERLMKAIVGAKLQPVGMHSEFAAVLSAFAYVNRRDGDLTHTTLYLDAGSAATKIMIAHGKEMAFARVVAVGGRHMDDAVADQLACMRADARQRRIALNTARPALAMVSAMRAERPAALPAALPGSLPNGVRVGLTPTKMDTAAGTGAPGEAVQSEALQGKDRRAPGASMPGFTGEIRQQSPVPVAPEEADLSDLLETLTDEVQMCVRYYASQFPTRKVERVVFVGGEARHLGLCQHIAKVLRLPAQMADPMARVARSGKEPATGIDLKQPQPAWAVPLGLCLSQTDL